MLRFLETDIYQITDIPLKIAKALNLKYNFNINQSHSVLKNFLSNFREDLWVFVEYPYVDIVYRDSYYTYFASKHIEYDRNTIRISLFNIEINERKFQNSKEHDNLKKAFLGIITIRPTFPQLIGRTMISPLALKNNNFYCCLCNSTFSVNGIKMQCSAFPCASQDTETLSCAETSIWSTMEYFGNKYIAYTPVLPSNIINVISNNFFRRLIPSEGLTVEQISLALKEFGFGSIIYSKTVYGKETLRNLLNIYIESGIPIITALSNQDSGHAVVLIGHASNDRMKEIGNLKAEELTNCINKVRLKSLVSSKYRYIVIDDNYSPYQISSFHKPTQYYSNKSFKNMEIKHIVVPLYKRIYLEAFKAHHLALSVIKNKYIGICSTNSLTNDTVIVRFLLTSSKSFKNGIASNLNMKNDLKKLLIKTSMPKFLWVAELSSEKLFSIDKAFGYIIIDATGRDSIDSVVFIVYPGLLFYKNEKGKFIRYEHDFGDFGIYRNNLKGEWNRWQA